MAEIRFVEIEEALRIHKRQVDRFGGDDGIRDRGLLESALATPRASFDGVFVHEDVIAMASAYLFHLCKNHPFVDGNKRVALAVMLYFMRRNGLSLEIDDQLLQNHVLAVASGQMDKDVFTDFLRKHLGTD